MGCRLEAVECHDYFLHRIIDLSICARDTRETEESIGEKKTPIKIVSEF
jgi:hypothetical protein